MEKKTTFRKFSPGASSGPATYDPKTRSVQAVIASEQPIDVFDFEEFRSVREILLMSGASWPENNQVPLCDCHQRNSTQNVLGSCRNIHVSGSELIADIHFSDDSNGQKVEKMYRDRHLTDLSIGASILECKNVPKNETLKLNGKEYKGPCRIVTRWHLFETSAVPVGADNKATVRSAKIMENEILTSQDDNQVVDPVMAERERVTEIINMCRIARLPKFAERFIADGFSVDAARERVFKEMARINPPFGPRLTVASEDVTDYKGRSAAMVDGLVMRSGFQLEKPARGAEEFRHSSCVDIARQSLHNMNIDTRGLSRAQIVKKAMITRSHTTSDFPAILANVQGKILRESYINAPSTFQRWTTKGEAADFKQVSRVQLSEAPDLGLVGELEEYTYGTFGESNEVFALRKYGKLIRLSWESVLGDDLGAFTRISKAFVMAAKRNLNAAAYKILTDNANMSDGVALFHDDHGNLAGSGAAIGIDSLTAARLAMRTQTGLQTSDPLNIEPKFLIVPAALETAADSLINTQEGYDASDGPGKRNPFHKKLEVIPEPTLDLVDDAAWYLAADPRQFDTVEVCYLDGQEAPFVEEATEFILDAWSFKIRFCWGIKALDWRGLYKNAGE